MGLFDVARQAEQAQLARDVNMSRHGMLNDDTPLRRAQYGGMYGSLMQDPADKARMERQMMEDTMAMMPMAGMTTYHGSPHIFDKFRMDKIGTGTGDANYGHGLYYTSNPRFAREHGQIYPDDPPGHLYKVDIPDDQIKKMLDWDDIPLSKQPKKVREALKDATSKLPENARELGRNAYAKLSEILGGEDKASAYLNSKGIPGIKYLDQGSRGGGQGTRNFVVFDENIPQILERNQQPIGGLLGK